MPGKYRITKIVTTEAAVLRTRIVIEEGDAAAPNPGGYYGTLSLIDETGSVVEQQQLAPEDLDPVVQQLTGLKSRAVADSGAVFVEAEAEEIPVEIDLGEVRAK